MALARSRVLAGPIEARDNLDRIIREVIASDRDEKELLKAVTTMRAEMEKHKKPGGPLDVKLLPGGLVDLEFVIHFLQLRGAKELADAHPTALDPELAKALAGLADAGLIPREICAEHDLMTRMLVAGRLLAPGGEVPPASAAKALAKACGQDSFDELLHRFANARHSVTAVWNAILGPRAEIEERSGAET